MVVPREVRVESSSVCQLRCPCCPTGNGTIGAGVGAGMLSAERFGSFLRANPQLEEIELSNWGEPFLNPELPEIARRAYEAGVAVTLNNGVNLASARPEALEAMVRYRVRSITVSIDGATPRAYGAYRVRGSLRRVIGHIRAINRLKREHRSAYPRLSWKFIVFGHNAHEIPKARRLAGALGMLFHLRTNWEPGYSPLRKEVAGSTPDRLADQRGACLGLWNAPQVNWDGRLLGCCVNHWGDFGGDAFAVPPEESFNTEKLRYARRMLLGRAPAREDIPCSSCARYARMRESGRYVTRAAIGRDRALRRARRLLVGLSDRLPPRWVSGALGWGLRALRWARVPLPA